MTRSLLLPLTAVVLSFGLHHEANAQHSLPKAEMYLKHGLTEDAKREAIDVIFSTGDKAVVAGAKLLLAQAAVKEDRLSLAVDLCKEILTTQPASPAAAGAQALLNQMISLTDNSLDQTVDNAVAQLYLSSADFWLDRLEMPYRVDTSWLPREGAAVYWLDRIISEFPGTPSAELAMYFKVRTYLGRESQDEYGSGGFGVLGAVTVLRGDANRAEAAESLKALMPKAKGAIAELEATFPESRHLPMLKFIMADVFWHSNKKEEATPWLEQVINSSPTESLWSQLARLRLSHWRGQ